VGIIALCPFGNPPRSLRDRAGGRKAFSVPDIMDAHLVVAVAAEMAAPLWR
jgi:hypothetical protein